jgi:hypothetical protein
MKRCYCLLFESRSCFFELLSSQILQPSHSLFVFCADLSDARIKGFLGVTLGLCRFVLQLLHLRIGLGFDLLRPLFRLVEHLL